MIKFEEHDDNLFRMLEEPVPLTDDAELPVLVRLIQDDTMLGKANKRSCHPDTLAQKIICSSKLTDDGLFMDGNYTYCYEISGTLVELRSSNSELRDVAHTYYHDIQELQNQLSDAEATINELNDYISRLEARTE